MTPINISDLLKLSDLARVKIRFDLMFQENWKPIEFFQNGQTVLMLVGRYWNYGKRKSFKAGQITIGLEWINPKED